MEKWIGKLCVVTGASSGIGEEAVKVLGKHGLVVIGIARRVEKIREISAENGGKIFGYKCDISKPDEVEKVFGEIEQKHGHIDILINNAGIFRLTGLIDCPVEDLKEVLDVNILGLSLCTREAVKSMRKRGNDGHIININSECGHRVPNYPGVDLGIYPASKFAVTAYCETLKNELAAKNSNIKVTSISPGTTLTNLVLEAHEQQAKDKIDPSEIKGVLKTTDITDAIIYILSASPGNNISEITLSALKNL